MYEKPILNYVGKAEDVILGIVSVGDDIDGYIYPVELEFEDDPNASPATRRR